MRYRSASLHVCDAATSCFSGTGCASGTSASSSTAWGGEAISYRSWAVQPEARPLERQFWRTRDVDLLEQALDEYVESLGRYVGVEAPA